MYRSLENHRLDIAKPLRKLRAQRRGFAASLKARRYVWSPLWFRRQIDHLLVAIGRSLWFFGRSRVGQPTRDRNSVELAIESGEASWPFFEYEQIYESACEHYGVDKIAKLSIKNREEYVTEVEQFLRHNRVEMYLWDPRTLSEQPWRSWRQTFRVALLFARHGVTPVVKLTDVQVRRWRSQTAVVSAAGGVCLTIMDPDRARRWAVHKCLVGPAPMPLSLRWVRSNSIPVRRRAAGEGKVRFVGSLYEPRKSFLQEVGRGLEQAGIELELHGRELGSPRMNPARYLALLSESSVTITTSRPSLLLGQDRIDDGHLVWRYFEALALGLPLVAEEVPGAEHLFRSGVHFLSFTTIAGAVESSIKLIQDPQLAEQLSVAGKDRVEEILKTRSFWHLVDDAVEKSRTPNERKVRHQRSDCAP